MTDAEIIKALECCRHSFCCDCPYEKYSENCTDKLITEAHRFVKHQQAEIEKQKKDVIDIDSFLRNLCKERLLNGNKIATFEDLQSYINKQKSEAIKEFAEKLKANFAKLDYKTDTHRKTCDVNFCDKTVNWVIHDITSAEIDNLVKEMTGGEE